MTEVNSEKAAELTRASDRIRETAKWLTVSLAVIGGALTAGVQFSNIGALGPGSDRLRLAIMGAVMAFIGISAVLFGTVRTATSPGVTLSSLYDTKATGPDSTPDTEATGPDSTPDTEATGPDSTPDKENQYDVYLLQGLPSIDALRTQYAKALGARLIAAEAQFNNPNAQTRQAAEGADLRLRFLDGIARNVLAVASYERLSRRWKRSAIIIGLGGILGVAGVLIFVWATNPPPDLSASHATPSVVGRISQTSINFTDTGREILEERLGNECDATKPIEGLLLQQSELGADVLVQQDGCAPLRILLTPAWGEAEPLADES